MKWFCSALAFGSKSPRRISGVAGVYQRHEWAAEKARCAQRWAAHLMAIVEGRAASPNVLVLARSGLGQIAG
jgi:hypothetical protein